MLPEGFSRIIIGVHFVLVGFNFLKQNQIRTKLLVGGGVDVSEYGPDCTHLIVDRTIYDDPICVAARRDGKVLVTGLWVEHSFDLGMTVDPVSDKAELKGEKYELAKKLKKIKLVNHRWLEDCLMAWEILPEARYD
ncbi:hypothetical protein K7X08_008423 [Anisodus acutangulus]|uniref:BRCT domain-containing protein n=1 Tax=Anisodus acutangulus TaxID=402998 RepID=A0A9Q1MQC7_9SOLA|nr:hypothetical protein K7X08_008423 [Anisodus acutangulus]